MSYTVSLCYLFFLIILRQPSSTLFPYTTLFRSDGDTGVRAGARRGERDPAAPAGVQGVQRRLRRRRSEEHTSELQSPDHLVCRLLLEKKKQPRNNRHARRLRNTRTGRHLLIGTL